MVYRTSLRDLLGGAKRLAEQGHLSNHREADPKFLDEAVASYSREFDRCPVSTKRLLRIRGLAWMEEVMGELQHLRGLRVFSANEFMKGRGTVSRHGGLCKLDVLEKFSEGASFGDERETYNVIMSKGRGLQRCASQFDYEAREEVSLVFLKLVSVFSTISGWIGGSPARTLNTINEMMDRYGDVSWNTIEMASEGNSCRTSMRELWDLCDNVLKMKLDILKDEVLDRQRMTTSRKLHMLDSDSRVTTDDVKDSIRNWCTAMVEEFLCWCYEHFCKDISEKTFMDAVETTTHSFLRQLMKALYGDFTGTVTFNVANFLPKLAAVADGKLSIARKGFPASKLGGKRYRDWCIEADASNRNVRSTPPSGSLEDDTTLPAEPVGRRSRNTNPQPASTPRPTSPPPGTPQPRTPPPDTPPQQDPLLAPLPPATTPKNASLHGMTTRSTRSRITTVPITGGPIVTSPQTPTKANLRSPVSNPGSAARANRNVTVTAEHSTTNQTSATPAQLRKLLQGDDDSDLEDGQCVAVWDRLKVKTYVMQLYSEVMSWDVDPRVKTATNLLRGGSVWAEDYVANERDRLYQDSFQCETLEQYEKHWFRCIIIDVRGYLQREITETFPSLMKKPIEFVNALPLENTFLRVIIMQNRESTNSTTVLKCLCTDTRMTTSMATQFARKVVCLAYLSNEKEPREPTSNMFIVVCHKVHLDESEIEEANQLEDASHKLDRSIDSLHMEIIMNTTQARNYSPAEGEVLNLRIITELSSYARTVQALMKIQILPKSVQSVFFGGPDQSEQDTGASRLRSYCGRRSSLRSFSSRSAHIDDGCLAHLQKLYDAGRVNASQLDAIRTVLENVGNCAPGSGSVTMVHGPPGTGKTSCIQHLMSTLLSHEVVGYKVDNSRDELQLQDNLCRRPKTNEAIRILVCAHSNTAVENIMERIDKQGLTDGDLQAYWPQMMRISKQGHKYGDLEKYSVSSKALPFDIKLYHPDEPDRVKPSWRALNALALEVAITFSTVSSCGSSNFRASKVGYDFVIVEEAGQLLESDMYVALVNAVAWARVSGRPLHVILVGDFKQLPPMHHGAMILQSYAGSTNDWDFQNQVKSTFQRLFEGNRCSYVMLKTQFRMHPTISAIHSHIFYGGDVVSGHSSSRFDTFYNQGFDSGGFAPLTIVDTSRNANSCETGRNGQYENMIEAQLVHNFVKILLDTDCDAGDPSNVINNIAIITPYHAQRVRIENEFRSRGGIWSTAENAKRIGVEICTVDSMQGREKDVIIVSFVRANRYKRIGFLSNYPRNNVALSRARKLLVIIGNMDTLAGSGRDGLLFLRNYIDYCRWGVSGAQLWTMFRDSLDLRVWRDPKPRHGPWALVK